GEAVAGLRRVDHRLTGRRHPPLGRPGEGVPPRRNASMIDLEMTNDGAKTRGGDEVSVSELNRDVLWNLLLWALDMLVQRAHEPPAMDPAELERKLGDLADLARVVQLLDYEYPDGVHRRADAP